MSKHTPGPWRAEMNGFCRMAVVDKNYTYLTYKAGTDRMPESELEANANLIAAAPDLLEALEGMIEAIECDDLVARDESIGSEGGDHVYHVRRRAEAAIARAKGESQ